MSFVRFNSLLEFGFDFTDFLWLILIGRVIVALGFFAYRLVIHLFFFGDDSFLFFGRGLAYVIVKVKNQNRITKGRRVLTFNAPAGDPEIVFVFPAHAFINDFYKRGSTFIFSGPGYCIRMGRTAGSDHHHSFYRIEQEFNSFCSREFKNTVFVKGDSLCCYAE